MADEITALADELTELLVADELTDEQLAHGEALYAKALEVRAAEQEKAARAQRDAKLRAALADLPKPGAPIAEDAKAGAIDVKGWEMPAGWQPPQFKTAADLFLESKSYTDFRDQYPNGLPESARVSLPPVLLGSAKSILGHGAKAVISSGDAAGLVSPPMQATPPVVPWGYQFAMRDLVTSGTTGSDTVEYARVLTMTNNAAPVAEASDTAGSGVKPESVLTFQKVVAAVKTIAHWLAATKRSLADAGQLRTLIESFLRFGLEAELEDQMLNGDGTGENFLGILNTPGTNAVPFATDVFTTVRKGITAVQVTGLTNPNGIVVHPSQLEAIDLAHDDNNRYYGAGPFGVSPRTLWGVPVVASISCPTDIAVVGDFRQAVLWDREQATITASDSHADFFIRNLVAILAELRAAFGVFRPQAFAECDLSAA